MRPRVSRPLSRTPRGALARAALTLALLLAAGPVAAQPASLGSSDGTPAASTDVVPAARETTTDPPSRPAPPSPTVPSPTVPSPTVPSPTVPSPTVPSPTVPSPTVPSPTVPSPTVPSPGAAPAASAASPPTLADAEPQPSPQDGVAVASPPASVSAETAHLLLHADRPGCWLELRSALGMEPWGRACDIPCDSTLPVAGKEARVAGAGLSSSNPFRIEPGTGVVRLAAETGTLRARRAGLVALATGLPLALGGLAVHAIGALEDDALLRPLGIGLAAAGGLGVVAAFPLLRAGATHVRDERRRRVAVAPLRPAL